MGADSVLVNAGLRLGMSRVPGDTAAIFDKQYEGLIAYHKATAQTTVEGAKAGMVLGSAIIGKYVEVLKNVAAGGAVADDSARQKKFGEAVYKSNKETKQESRDRDLEAYKKKLDAKERSKHLDDEPPVADEARESGSEGVESSQRLEGGSSIEGGEVLKLGDQGWEGGSGISGGDSPSSGGGSSSPTLKLRKSPFKQQENKTTSGKNSSVKIGFKPRTSILNEEVQSSNQKSPSAKELNGTIETMVTDLAVDGIKKAGKHYGEGGGMNDGHFNAAELAFRGLKSNIYNIINQESVSIEDKKLKNKYQKDTEKLKRNVVSIKGLVMQTAQAYNEGHVNADLSFLGRANEQMLLKQVMDPNAKLEKLGVDAFWEDGELYYEYGPSQIGMEYASNKGIEIDPEEIMSQERKTIPATTLFGMAVLKDTKSENDINGVIKKAGEDAIATIGNTDNILNTNFDRVKAKLEKNFSDILEGEDVNLQDLATRDLTIGNSKRNFKKDLEASPEINALTYSNLGLTASVDSNKDGVLSSDELTKEDKAIVIETLTNPRTSDQKAASINERKKYLLAFAREEFNYMRKASGEDDKEPKKTVEDYLNQIS